MKHFQTFLKVLDTVSEWSGRIFIWLIIPLTCVVVYEVIARRVFNSPHIWSTEVTAYLYGPHFMLAAAYTLLHRGHVSIDIIYQRFSPRLKGIVQTFNYLVFFFPFCFVIFHQGILFAQTSWAQNETSGSAALTIVPLIKTVIPFTFFLLLLQGLANMIRSIALAIRGREL